MDGLGQLQPPNGQDIKPIMAIMYNGEHVRSQPTSIPTHLSGVTNEETEDFGLVGICMIDGKRKV